MKANVNPTRSEHSLASSNCVLSQRQVASLLGISQTRVTQIERRALNKLRQAIAEDAQATGQSVREWISGEVS